MKAFAPNGLKIVGTLEHIPATSPITLDSFSREEDGKIAFSHVGGTEIYWNEQKTLTRNGLTVFVDEDGEEWTEDQLVLRENADDEDPEE